MLFCLKDIRSVARSRQVAIHLNIFFLTACDIRILKVLIILYKLLCTQVYVFTILLVCMVKTYTGAPEGSRSGGGQPHEKGTSAEGARNL